MNTHVFVVDSTTFKIHLEYMFAGTGARDKRSPFLMNYEVNYNASTERNLVGMIADISRIRKGDNVAFYLQSNAQKPGMFFGVFSVEEEAFFDENDENNYLVNDLGKGLSFRVGISPKTIFARGVTEHEYLDDLFEKDNPCQLCWSMIYRKLKGNRGCTMITDYEFEDLLCKLRKKNDDTILNGKHYSYNEEIGEIVSTDLMCSYDGRKETLIIGPRLIYKASKGNAFETHLQAYVLQNYDKPILSKYLLSLKNGDVWIGNEVSCGVGMQRIDILVVEENKEEIHLRIIELKDEEPLDYILDFQLPWYLKWVSQYMLPNYLRSGKNIVLHPCILAKKTMNADMINRIKTRELISENDHRINISTTEYIGFSIIDNELIFEKIV